MEIDVLENMEYGEAVTISVNGETYTGTIGDVDDKHNRVLIDLGN